MTRLVLVGLALVLAGCGIDGEPIKPRYTVKQTFAINSKTGPRSETALFIDLTKGQVEEAPESEF